MQKFEIDAVLSRNLYSEYHHIINSPGLPFILTQQCVGESGHLMMLLKYNFIRALFSHLSQRH